MNWLNRGDSAVPATIISIALMLAAGFLMTRITKKLRLPNVTAYIVGGILAGPFVLNLIPQTIVEGTSFLPDIALAFIAFSTGEFFRLSALKKNGGKVVTITVLESCGAAILVFLTCHLILGLNFAFSVVLGALATATAPASTIMTIRQTGAKGDFVETLLQVVALDDVVGLVLYSMAISLATAVFSSTGFQVSAVLIPLGKNLLLLLLGCLFGLILKWLVGTRRSTDNRLIIAIAVLFSYCGICAVIDVSPLLGCMAMGMVYINTTEDERMFRQLNYFSPPILLLFFFRSGLSFDLGSLFNQSESVGAVPLLIVGVIYFLVRILGKYVGAWSGCHLAGKSPKVRNFLGLALIPQAGVAIGLAALGARELGGEMGHALETIILSSSVLYELIGPGAAKLSLWLSGSYSNELEDLAQVPETTETGEKKSELELLIERIQKIQSELPAHSENENEKAFTEAAEEYYRDQTQPQPRSRRRGPRRDIF
ncbi:cation:proton antiporter [Clostridiales bacterium FE2011]|nr:cation:proton antiporter [Clostridiales bacterium FE2011]QTE75863.1 cation:proton antiporter [Clostridiales bacterium FE2010]